MRIRVKLFASLSELMPDGVKPHEGFELDVAEDTTPTQLIQRLKVPDGLAHLVMINGEYVPPSRREQPVLSEGDVFAVWPPVAGG
ncbi:MAG: MoaD/ThiS family protein [Ectothiorhodospiraceae bacterium]|nr:MoaD/ThiS family protein [Ectothiorhodospiraceae bacterium]